MQRSEIIRAVQAAVRGAHATAKGWYRAPCPFCLERTGTEDRRRSFGLHSRGWYRCFRCGSTGRLKQLDQGEADVDVQAEELDVQRPEGFYDLTQVAGAESAREPITYLHSRGVDDQLIAKARIGACFSGYHYGRVVVPVLATDGVTWLGWVGRVWQAGKFERPYLNMPGAWRSKILYNHQALFQETDEPVMVVEGSFDALWLWPDGVAALGKVSSWQFDALLASRRPIAVVADGDAHEEGWSLACRLRLYDVSAGSVRLPPKKDPDDIPRAVVRDAAWSCIGGEVEI